VRAWTTAYLGLAVAERPVMTPEKIAAAQSLPPEHSISAIARMVGVSRGTLYAHMDAITAAGRS
jgi:transposase-like protein